MDALFLREWQAFLRYEDLSGSDPVRVYLALGGAPAFTRVATDPALAGTRSVIPDLLGFGYSDRPLDFSYTLEDHTLTIAALLDHLDLRGCDVIGHSFGGSVAITLAATRPQLVSRLVLLDANLDPGGGAFSSWVAGQSEEEYCAVGFDELLARSHAQGVAGDSGSAVFSGMVAVAAPYAIHRSCVSIVRGTQPTMRENLYRLSIPRTFLIGAKSLPDPNTDELPKHGVQVAVVTEAGHGMMWDNPAAVAGLISEALA